MKIRLILIDSNYLTGQKTTKQQQQQQKVAAARARSFARINFNNFSSYSHSDSRELNLFN